MYLLGLGGENTDAHTRFFVHQRRVSADRLGCNNALYFARDLLAGKVSQARGLTDRILRACALSGGFPGFCARSCAVFLRALLRRTGLR